MEKRKFERFALEAPTRVEYTSESGGKEIIYLKAKEISAGGAYLRHSRPLPAGKHLQIEFYFTVPRIPGLKEEQNEIIVRLGGRVLRSEPDGIAVSFDQKYILQAFGSD